MNRFLKSATLVATLTAGLVACSSAAIVYFPFQNIPIPTNSVGVNVNLTTGAFANTDDAPGYDVNFFFGGAGLGNDTDSAALQPTFQPVRTGMGNFDAIDNLAFGSTVDVSSTFSTAALPNFGGSGDPNSHIPAPFTAGEEGYIGFSLDIGGNTHYGWMLVKLQDNAEGGIIKKWAYDDTPNQAILVGVPEPSVPLLGLLALGGLAFRRRR